MSSAGLAAKYSVRFAWVRRLKQRRRETGSTEPIPRRCGSPPKWAGHAERIAQSVREVPDATPEEHRRRLGLDLGISTLWRAIPRPGPDSQKEAPKAAERDRPDVVQARRGWREAMPGLDPERLVFLDETRASTDMTRSRGRSPSGTRLGMSVPHGHRKTTPFVAASRADGLVAPTVAAERSTATCPLPTSASSWCRPRGGARWW